LQRRSVTANGALKVNRLKGDGRPMSSSVAIAADRTRTDDLRFTKPEEDPISAETATTYSGNDDRLAVSLAKVVEAAPDLASVVDAWQALPESIRAGIVAMVNAATASK